MWKKLLPLGIVLASLVLQPSTAKAQWFEPVEGVIQSDPPGRDVNLRQAPSFYSDVRNVTYDGSPATVMECVTEDNLSWCFVVAESRDALKPDPPNTAPHSHEATGWVFEPYVHISDGE